MLPPGLSIIMPYACALFDRHTDAAMRETINKIASNSAFEQTNHPFHVPLMGSLHTYSDDEVAAALSVMPDNLSGRFVKWELDGRSSILRAIVELDDVDVLLALLQQALPAGKAWRTHYVTLGSVGKIDKDARADFLAALNATFPIDPSMTFAVGSLVFHNVPRPALEVTTTTTSGLNPGAKPFTPKLKVSSSRSICKKTRSNNKRSPHRKWDRGRAVTIKPCANAEKSSIDKLIMGAVKDVRNKHKK